MTARIWRVRVGRVNLFLLDTNLAANRPDDRDITDQLYGGDLEMRLKQEILLGIGGYRALGGAGTRAHGLSHERGSLVLPRGGVGSPLMEKQKLSLPEAREVASAGLIFTTHTPVPAGHDYFPPA